MRLDKFLKVSRVIKRRPVANEACDAGRVMINGKVAKASTEVKIGDVVEIKFGDKMIIKNADKQQSRLSLLIFALFQRQKHHLLKL